MNATISDDELLYKQTELWLMASEPFSATF